MELIKTEMTPRERLTAYAKGEEVDRIPTLITMTDSGSTLYGIKCSDYAFSADLMVEVEARLAEDFHADNMGPSFALRSLGEALGSKMAYPEWRTSYVAEPCMKSFDDLDRLKIPDVNKDGRFPIILEAFEKLQERFSKTHIIGSGIGGPLTTATSIYGTEKLLRAMIKEKENVHRLMQFCTDCVVKCCEDIHSRVGIGMMIAEPIATKNLLSKKQVDEFFFPYLNQLVERMNKFQGATPFHICGYTRDRWQEVVDSGICTFWIDNCENLRELKELYGDRISISGKLTPTDTMLNGTFADIENEVKLCLAEGADSPCGFTLCPGCDTPIGTAKDNITAYMNAAATYGRGAQKGKMPKGMEGVIAA